MPESTGQIVRAEITCVSMKYVKIGLCVLAALMLAALVVGLSTAFRGMSQEKATGLAVIQAEMLASVVTPLFWFLAVGSFAVFFTTGRLTNGVLRGLLFWFPTLFISSLGISLLSWFAWLMLHLKRS